VHGRRIGKRGGKRTTVKNTEGAKRAGGCPYGAHIFGVVSDVWGKVLQIFEAGKVRRRIWECGGVKQRH